MKGWDENEFALLDDYLAGRLAPEARHLLELRLATDYDLKQQLEEMAALQEGIRSAGRKEMLSEIEGWERTAQHKEGVAVPLWRKPWAVGIAATVLIAITWFLFSPDQKPSNELFAKNFEPYPNVVMPAVRGSSPDSPLPLKEAFSAYDNEEYERAATLFENVEVKNETVWLYLGNCYLGLGKAAEAIRVLENLKQAGSTFATQGRWYLALAYVLNGENQKAMLLLQPLESDPAYGQRAVALQQSLHKK